MLPNTASFLPLLLAPLVLLLPYVKAQCDPLQTTCPPIPGLTQEYSVDFTQQSTLPEGWILANYATVNYSSNGAEFSFNKRFDAPYIWTNFYILFGQVDVVMQAAPGTAIISSAVLMSDDQDEIDWEWSGNNFATASGKVQTNYFGKGVTGNYDRGSQPAVDSPQTRFHTYSFDWMPTALTWSIDGQPIRTLKAAGSDNGAHQYPQSPSRLHLGVWCAGDPDTNSATANWAGGYTDFTKAPFTAYVKSVKITNMNPCPQYQYGDKSGSWQSIKCINTPVNSTSSSSIAPSSSSLSSATPSTVPITSNGSRALSSSNLSSVPTSSNASPTSSGEPDFVSSPPSGSKNEVSFTSTTSPPSVSISPTSSSASSGTETSFTRASTSFSSSFSTPSPIAPSSSTTYTTCSDSRAASPSLPHGPPAPTDSGGTNASGGTSSRPTTAPTTSRSSIGRSQPSPSSSPSSSTTKLPPSTPNKPTVIPITSFPSLTCSTSSPSVSPSSARTTPPQCHQDNCLRNLLDPRYSRSASSLCSAYPTAAPVTGAGAPVSTWLAGCSGVVSRVSSACGCWKRFAAATATGGR